METQLYPPIKGFFEALGYSVKGEIGRCDVVALKEGGAPIVVVCELKTAFNLELVLQGVDRLKLGDEVWLAARLSPRGKGRESDTRYRALCRMLGMGLLGVSSTGRVEILSEPTGQAPRRSARQRARLVEEHRKRRGDPVSGGSTRRPIMTAYRQQALGLAAAIATEPLRPRDLTPRFPDAPKILQRNVYGWFERVERGVYGLTATGREAVEGHIAPGG